jgi:hypothetical protein
VERALVLVADPDNPDQGDLLLTAGRTTLTTTLADEVAQRILVRFRFFKGEWFRNLDAGTPWIQVLFEKATPDSTIKGVLSQLVSTTEGVSAVESMVLVRTGRELEVTFTARLKDGTVFVSSHYGPFVLTPAA